MIEKSHHVVFSRLTDPADVVIILLPHTLSHVCADLLQDGGGNVISQRQVTGFPRSADPAEGPKTQGKYVTEGRRVYGLCTNL